MDRLLAADVDRRSAVAAGDSLRAEHKSFGRTIGKASAADRPALLERGKQMSVAVRVAEAAELAANQELTATHVALPNVIEGAPMIPPVLVKPESMEGTGFLGEHADEVYRLAADDLFLVGTSEVP